MTDVQSDPTPRGVRPAVVTMAAYLMFAVAVLGVILAVLPLPYASHVSDVAKHAYANAQNGDQLASAATLGIYIGLVVDLLGAAALVLLAVFNLRGSNVTRIMTWVLAGLGVLCCGGGTLLGRLASGMSTTNTNGVDLKAAQREVAHAYPSWYQGVQITLTLLAVLALIVIIILLALPAAHPWFRRRTDLAIDEPPLPTYPSYPSVPPVEAAPPVAPEPPSGETPPAPPVPPEQPER